MFDIQDVSVRFRRSSALKHVSLSADGGLVALLGPNGAGKTTLMRVLVTAQYPDAGTVTVAGFRWTGESNDRSVREIRSRIGYLPQDTPSLPNFKAREFVAYMGWVRGLTSTEADREAVAALERVGLSERAETPIKALSGGMRQRVGLAQAIVNCPDLLVLDEPTVGLDPHQRTEFRQLVTGLAEDRTVLVSTHLVEDVALWGCRTVVMDNGRLVFDGHSGDLVALGAGAAGEESSIERGYFAALDGVHKRA